MSLRTNKRGCTWFCELMSNLTETGNPPVILGILSNYSQNFPDISKNNLNFRQNQQSSF